MKKRNEIDKKYKWDLTHIYESVEEFYSNCDLLEKQINEIDNFVDKDLSNKYILKECLDLSNQLGKVLYRLHTYSQRTLDQEQDNEEATKLVQRISDISTIYSTKTDFITTEISNFDDDVLKNLFDDDLLEEYQFDIMETIREKEHILSTIEENLLSNISDAFSTSSEVYTVFKNTEMKHGTVTLEDGSDVILNSIEYDKLRRSNNRKDREKTYLEYWKSFDNNKNTLSKLMYKKIKNSVTLSKIRKYDSCLARSLSSENIPINVYNNLIKNISHNLDKFQEYLDLRKNTLKYDTLKYSDLYNPIVNNKDFKFTYDEAKELVLKSTSVLGEDYTKIMSKAFNESWIDVYPNKNKDTGAYMCGSAYDVHPYILLNYTDKYDDVSTLAHELGHAGHSFYSNATQKFNNAHYSTFIAEIASITNELLLFEYMLKNTNDKDLKIELLNNYIESFRTTVFRQTMFAEFEKIMYDTVENDEVLTPSTLNDKYLSLLKKYHTDMDIEDVYGNEWASVPHFYYNFYVYQYSTSFIAANIIANRILNGDKEQLVNYIELLKSGGSDHPIELLKKAGVDFTDESCYNVAFDDFDKRLKELKKLISLK
jgi:oligoendopeptidase F